MDGCVGYCGRQYFSKKERIEWLNEYKKNLEDEAKGVAERIRELEKEK